MNRIPAEALDSPETMRRAARFLNQDDAKDFIKIIIITRKDVIRKLGHVKDRDEFCRHQGIFQLLEDIEELTSYKS